MNFPLFIDISEKKILVVGAGTIATRRVKTLLRFGAKIAVVADKISEEMAALAGGDESNLSLIEREIEAADLEGCDIVCAATNDHAVNRAIYDLCKARGILVNVASDQSLCDFHFPGVVIDGDMVVGINASGKDHSKVKHARELIEGLFQKE